MKYFKTDESGGKNLCHDVIFMPDSKGWAYIKRRISGDFIPDNRYLRMAKQASAIFQTTAI